MVLVDKKSEWKPRDSNFRFAKHDTWWRFIHVFYLKTSSNNEVLHHFTFSVEKLLSWTEEKVSVFNSGHPHLVNGFLFTLHLIGSIFFIFTGWWIQINIFLSIFPFSNSKMMMAFNPKTPPIAQPPLMEWTPDGFMYAYTMPLPFFHQHGPW